MLSVMRWRSRTDAVPYLQTNFSKKLTEKRFCALSGGILPE